MWREGGRFYWGCKEERQEGIVVVFAWLSSKEKHLKPYIDLYASFGWRSLLCHVDFLTLFFPEKARLLAEAVIKELVQELKIIQLPIVFAAFSGGPKGCMYKIIQLIDGTSEGQLARDDYELLKGSICGQIYDSSPVDFTSDLGTRFVLHPTVLRRPNPPKVVSWMAKAVASGLDTLFISNFEAQRVDYWETLYSSVNFGPFLIFCSEDDELAPFPVVCGFAQRLQELGGTVRLVQWKNSPHVGHYKHHPAEYRAAIIELLSKANAVYAERRLQLAGKMGDIRTASNISVSGCSPLKAAASSNENLRVVLEPRKDFSLPSSMEYNETEDKCSTQGKQKDEHFFHELFHMQNIPNINANGVLGQLLPNVCFPKNIEDWEIKSLTSLDGEETVSSNGHGPFNPVKCILRPRL